MTTGLCLLSACSPRKYILVEKLKTWTEAQSYCRDRYTDLATVRNKQDLTELNELISSYNLVWIGLNYDENAKYEWSQENEENDDPKDTEYTNMIIDSLGDTNPYRETCVSASKKRREWFAWHCASVYPFICYNVNETKAWDKAQSYCREHYTDLATVRNGTEEEIYMTLDSRQTWVGLYRTPWKWSDGSKYMFRHWKKTLTPKENQCVAVVFGSWDPHTCTKEYYFACHYEPPKTRKQVVKVALKKTDSSVDMEALKRGILQKLQQKLKDQGLDEGIKLSWVEKPDGKVFHKAKKVKNEEKSHDRKGEL
ncbi:C-type mannose receptor 2-like [Xyrichtys novacula]|uniref:C-type mannose receptor 2-like n=1 Tax=Xyrichtys novacula TaxID=13765 RepID=A0AAV1GV34_XYRNO|nr:C-type mannose receptor 2-like [Xyrichtys novacula]